MKKKCLQPDIQVLCHMIVLLLFNKTHSSVITLQRKTPLKMINLLHKWRHWLANLLLKDKLLF